MTGCGGGIVSVPGRAGDLLLFPIRTEVRLSPQQKDRELDRHAYDTRLRILLRIPMDLDARRGLEANG